MTQDIQARADRYSDAVTQAMRNTMRAARLADHEMLAAPLTMAQIARLSEHAGVAPADWFPLRASLS